MPAEASLPFESAAPERHISAWLLPAIAACILLAIVVWAPQFLKPANVMNLLRQVALNGIIACGMTIVMVAGGFDLSVGAVAALAGVLAIQIAPANLGLAILLPVFAGAFAGAANGFLVTRWSVNPLIATLGMRYVLYAVANVITGGFIQVNRVPAFGVLGASIFGIPFPAATFGLVALLVHVALRYTTWGAKIYAIGANERAARFCGIRTRVVQVIAYSCCGAAAATAGVVLAARSGAAPPDAGSGFELDAIAAAVIGGVSIFGGAGGAIQAVRGVVLLGMLSNFLVLARQPYEMQRIVTGAIIVAAIAVDKMRRRNTA